MRGAEMPVICSTSTARATLPAGLCLPAAHEPGRGHVSSLWSMFGLCAVVLAAAAPAASLADTERFDSTQPGSLPPGWDAGSTGAGSPKWAVIADPSAPSPPNVLNQSGSGTYPWAVKKDASLADGFVETRFKSISGNEDQAAGLLWRWKNGNTYYVARANAKENNVALYYTAGGVRRTLKSVAVTVRPGLWNTLRVEFQGTKISVSFNGVVYIESEDKHIQGAGAVGVWTKSDSVTSFDEFSFGSK
jgi:hypothetical protein